MAKRKEPPKPIFPLKHEFYDALDNFITRASMLQIAVDTALSIDTTMKPAIREALQTAVTEFKAAWSAE